MHVHRIGKEGKLATDQEIKEHKDKIQGENKLDVQILMVFEIDTSQLKAGPDMLKEAVRDTVEKAVRKAFGEFDTAKFMSAKICPS